MEDAVLAPTLVTQRLKQEGLQGFIGTNQMLRKQRRTIEYIKKLINAVE